MRVLIVEDDAMNIELLALRLGALECEVLVAKTAEEGRELASTRAPELILVDLKLENDVQNGMQLVKWLHEAPETKGIPVIVHSVFVSHPSDAPEALPLADGYLPKPFQFLELKGLVESVRAAKQRA